MQRGRSHGVRALLEELRGKHIALWQLMVQNTDLEQGSWLKGTPAFSTLFPNGRRPFQQGGIDSRIEAVGALADKLEQIPAMEPVAMLVRKYFRRLGDARKSQQQERGTKKERSAALEDQRRSAALALYKNMARLMEKYAETPDRILTFFDLRNVRQPFRRKSATGLDS